MVTRNRATPNGLLGICTGKNNAKRSADDAPTEIDGGAPDTIGILLKVSPVRSRRIQYAAAGPRTSAFFDFGIVFPHFVHFLKYTAHTPLARRSPTPFSVLPFSAPMRRAYATRIFTHARHFNRTVQHGTIFKHRPTLATVYRFSRRVSDQRCFITYRDVRI